MKNALTTGRNTDRTKTRRAVAKLETIERRIIKLQAAWGSLNQQSIDTTFVELALAKTFGERHWAEQAVSQLVKLRADRATQALPA